MRTAFLVLASLELALACSAAPSPKPPIVAPVCSASATPPPPPCPSTNTCPKPEEPPCEHAWAKSAGDVSLAWNSCKVPTVRFASRGFPAIRKDGKRIAFADDFSGNNSWFTRLAVRVVDVDSDKMVETIGVVGAGEFGEPGEPSDADRATIDARIAAANDRLRDFEPILGDACGQPEPWPNARLSGFDACTAAKRPPQLIACGSAEHLLTIELHPPRLAVAVDGKKPFVDRGVPTWTHRVPAYDPAQKGTRPYDPILVEARADFARRTAVLRVEYCNTVDSDPFFASEWHAVRLPK